jgi:holliday junction DNA helicase RuvA
MISYIKGIIKSKTEDEIILENKGFGFKIFVSKKNSALLKNGEEKELYTHFVIRNEKPELYGFLSQEELSVFEIIENISGIGPKGALVISSLGTLEDLKEAVREKNFSYFSKIKGIGNKKVQKIILELGGSFKDLGQSSIYRDDEALKALVSLGFSVKEAKKALESIPNDFSQTKEKVQAALKFFHNEKKS